MKKYIREKETLEKFGIVSPAFVTSFYEVGTQYIWLPDFSEIDKEIKHSKEAAVATLKKMAEKKYTPWHFMKYALSPENMEVCKKVIKSEFSAFDEIILLGTGGSSLGAKALCELQSYAGNTQKKISFFDNIDPKPFELLMRRSDLEHIGVLIITKSGSTPETMAQVTYLIDLWEKKLGKAAISKQFMCITEPKDSPVSRLAKTYNILCLPHDSLLGGRFSVVSQVGLLPLLLVGGSISQFQEGLVQVAESLKYTEKLPAATFVAVHNALEKVSNLQEVIVMSYGDAWRYVPPWFMQLWGESLGKNGRGTMPVGSLGTQDQHSLLQLFLDGPRNKFFTIIISKEYGKAAVLHPIDTDLNYLKGKTLGDLMEAEAWATVRALIENKCPVRVLHLDNFQEKSLGVSMLNWMIETALQASIWGIDAFDQPAVEQGKILTKQYLKG